MRVEDALREFWGFESLRPLQDEVIESALTGRDAVVVMPTGGGKSLCFQVPPLVDGGLTVVVSPLISLMKDQVDALKLIGYPGEAIHSNVPDQEVDGIYRRLRSGETKLIYISPERILTGAMLATLRNAGLGKGVARIAIDEAHCISQWGHDFRPEYRRLAELRNEFPTACMHALTATATPRVRKDIGMQLGFRGAALHVGIFDRPNLTYRIVPKSDPLRQIADAVKQHPDDASIVYCLSRKDTERVAGALQTLGVPAVAYHAGLDPVDRQKISEDFARERTQVVVATVAFGMGIDRANVRWVIHETMPRSIEAYQQETGRAGRDGLPSECLMLYAPNDYVRWERLIRESIAPDQLPHQIGMIDEVRRFANGTQCRHAFLSQYFGQEYRAPSDEGCEACDLCLEGWQVVPDSAKRAHQVLATVIDLEKRHQDLGFGARHVAEVLAGSDTKGIRRFGHQDLRGYGRMAGTTVDKIATWVTQLVDLKLLERTGEKFPVLKVTEEGRNALRTQQEVILRDVALPESKRSKRRHTLPTDFDEPLFEALRSMRRELAAEREVPAYVLFHDSVLITLSSVRPTSMESLKKISGIGERRAADLGPTVLEIIRRHVQVRDLPADRWQEDLREATVTAPSNATSIRLRPMFERGLTLSELAQQSGLAESTIGGYLVEWIEETHPKSIEVWVSSEIDRRIRKAIDELGWVRLKPLYEALEGEVDYGLIRIVVAHRKVSERVEIEV